MPEAEYAYLLGMYLGDGDISRSGARCYRLRITMDLSYPGVIREPWQESIVHAHLHRFLRGLMHSDGCRVVNRVNGKSYPRYFFTQVSQDIRELFCETCDQLGIVTTSRHRKSVSIARASSVALLDSFVGAKA